MVQRIQDIKDDGIRKLAETLRSSGLAASETEAIRIATGMSQTTDKANQSFEQRKGTASTMLANMNKVYPKKEEQKTEQPQQTPNFAKEEHHAHHTHHEHHHADEECCGGDCHDCHHVDEETEIVEYADNESPKKDVFEVKEEDEVVHQELVSREPETKKENQESQQEKSLDNMTVAEAAGQKEEQVPQEKKEEQKEEDGKPKPVWEERKPKKDASQMEESRVDLGAVFKFKG